MKTPSKEVVAIFARVTKHLLTQNAKSEFFNAETQSIECRYLSPTGLTCAIGCLIAPNCYNPKIEGASMRALTLEEAHNYERSFQLRKTLECSLIPLSEETIRIMIGLQQIHDQHAVKEWLKELKDFAIRNEIPYDWSQHG